MEMEITRRAPPGQNASVLFVCIIPLGAAFAWELVSGAAANVKTRLVSKNSRRAIILLTAILFFQPVHLPYRFYVKQFFNSTLRKVWRSPNNPGRCPFVGF